MNELKSYLRHVLTGLLLWAANKWGLPEDGLGDAVLALVNALILASGWLIVKYVMPILRDQGIVKCLVALIGLSCLFVASCANQYVDAAVDTRGAKVTAPDNDGDGIPDGLQVPASQVAPVVNADALNEFVQQGINQANDALVEAVK